MSETATQQKPIPIFLGSHLVLPFRTAEKGAFCPVLEGTVSPATSKEGRIQETMRSFRARKAGDSLEEVKKLTSDLADMQAEFIAKHIKTWNREEPITPATVAMLPEELLSQLEAIVLGYSGLLLGNSVATSPSS